MRPSRVLWATVIGGLLLFGCSSTPMSSDNQTKTETNQCPAGAGGVNEGVNAQHLAIVGTAKPGKAQAAFKEVEGLSLASGGCLVKFSIGGQVIDVYSAPQTSKHDLAVFVGGMKSSGEFISVVTK